MEGDITSISFPVSIGLACIELWVETDRGIRQRWAVECRDERAQEVLQIVKPGDRVIVVGLPPQGHRPLSES